MRTVGEEISELMSSGLTREEAVQQIAKKHIDESTTEALRAYVDRKVAEEFYAQAEKGWANTIMSDETRAWIEESRSKGIDPDRFLSITTKYENGPLDQHGAPNE